MTMMSREEYERHFRGTSLGKACDQSGLEARVLLLEREVYDSRVAIQEISDRIETLLSDPPPSARPLISYESKMAEICEIVAKHAGLSLIEFYSPRRSITFARPRMIAIKIILDTTKASLPEVGRHMGRHHATVLHARRRAEELIRTNPSMCQLYHDVTAELDEQKAVSDQD